MRQEPRSAHGAEPPSPECDHSALWIRDGYPALGQMVELIAEAILGAQESPESQLLPGQTGGRSSRRPVTNIVLRHGVWTLTEKPEVVRTVTKDI